MSQIENTKTNNPRKYFTEWDRVRHYKYGAHKGVAKQRNIPFLLSFDEWWLMWEQSGKWDERGNSRGKYVMSRIGDMGPYAVGNVIIQLHSDNIRQAHYGNTHSKGKVPWNKGIPQTEESNRKRSESQLGKSKIQPKISCIHCSLVSTKTNINRWHNDNCRIKND